MAPIATIVLRSVVPIISKESRKRAHLEEDLTTIGCIGLISKPWSVKDKKMVWELLMGAPNQFNMTIRCHPEKWTAEK